MPVDRGIIAILFYNKITDVDKVEDFIGENDGYYEIKINGEIKKLEIPDRTYINNLDNMINTIIENDKFENETTKHQKDLENELIKIQNNMIETTEINNRKKNELILNHKKLKSDSAEKRIKFVEDLKKREIALGIIKEPITQNLINPSGTTSGTTSNIETPIEKTVENTPVNTADEQVKSTKISDIKPETIKDSVDIINNKKEDNKKEQPVITKIIKTETYFSSDTNNKEDDSDKNDTKKTTTKSKKSDDDEYITSI